MNYLSREEILARATFRIEEVAVPQWDTTVRVRELSAMDKDKLQMSMVDMSKVGENGTSDGAVSQSSLLGIRAKLICYCVVDEKGARIFADSDLSRPLETCPPSRWSRSSTWPCASAG